VNVQFGPKTLLLLGATIVFLLAVIDEKDYKNLLAWGLAAVALALLVADIGWDRKYGGPRGPR